MHTLSQKDKILFQEQGFLKIPGLLEKDYAIQLQHEIWKELEEEFGIIENDPTSWRTPPHSPRKAKVSNTNINLINDHFRLIIDDLIGPDQWKEPQSWGGFLINFPTENDTPLTLHDKLWHWDYELFREPELGGLLIFSFYSSVPPGGGGTLIIKGSHRVLREWKASMTKEQINRKHGIHRKEIMKSHPYLKKLTSPPEHIDEHISYFMDSESSVDGNKLQVVQLIGEPGDVVFCHPRLIHAPAEVNFNKFPRMMRTKFLW